MNVVMLLEISFSNITSWHYEVSETVANPDNKKGNRLGLFELRMCSSISTNTTFETGLIAWINMTLPPILSDHLSSSGVMLQKSKYLEPAERQRRKVHYVTAQE